MSIVAISLGLEKFKRPVAKRVTRVIQADIKGHKYPDQRKQREAPDESYDHLRNICDMARATSITMYKSTMGNREMTAEQLGRALGKTFAACSSQMARFRKQGLVVVSGGGTRNGDPFRYRWIGN
jgi:CRP-like cAMP-binding protein